MAIVPEINVNILSGRTVHVTESVLQVGHFPMQEFTTCPIKKNVSFHCANRRRATLLGETNVSVSTIKNDDSRTQSNPTLFK